MQNIPAAQLNGMWHMQPEKGALDKPKGSSWCTVEIPAPWSAFSPRTGVPDEMIPHRKAWFRKTFAVPEIPPTSRLMLHFDAVNFFATVLVNGKHCGQNTGDCIPFDVDITNAVQGGGEALLLVGVQDISAAEQPASKNMSGLRKLIYPGLGTHPGIWGDVYLWVRPAVHITDITIKTIIPEHGQSIAREGHVRIKVQIQNDLAKAANFSFTSEIYDGARQVLPFAPISGSIAAGQKSELDFGTEWESASFWWPDQPHLYSLRAGIWTDQHSEEGEIAHRTAIPIGFREFKVKGRHFSLNNSPVKLRSEAICPVSGKLFGDTGGGPFPPHRDSIVKMFESYKKLYNINTLRFHRLPPPTSLLDAADQAGLMVIVELPLPDDEMRYAVDNPEFWKHAREFAQKWIAARLHHPSIIMWSVGQGMIQRYGSRVTENLTNLVKFIKDLDPSRQVELSGDVLPVNFGEPASCTISTFFPDTGVTFRTIEPHKPESLRDRVLPRAVKITTAIPDPPDRPTGILEHTRRTLRPDSMAFYLGDAAYSPSLTSEKLAELGHIEMGACRIAGIDSIGMIGRRIKADPSDDTASDVAAIPKELYGNTYAGSTLSENLLICNDTRLDQDFTLTSKLVTEDGAVAEHSEEIMLPAGASEPKTVSFDIPPVTEVPEAEKTALARQAELHIELTGSRTGSFKSKKDITIWPHVRSQGTRKIQLIDPAETTAPALAAVGVKYDTVQALKPSGYDTVIVGERAASRTFTEAAAIRDFVQRGGLAIYLAQETIPHDLSPVTLILDRQGAASITFIRDADSPIFEGISNANMRWWRDGHILAAQCFRKPSRGNFRCMLDAGGTRGMGWAGIVEVFHGKGSFIFVQAELVERAAREPVAALLLARLADAKPSWSPGKVRMLAGSPFSSIGVVTPELMEDFDADIIKHIKTILISGTELPKLKPNQLEALAEWTKAGGTLYLHRLTPEHQAFIDTISDTKLELVDSPQERLVMRSPGAGLMRGLSSADLSLTDHASRSMGAMPVKYTAVDTVVHTFAATDDAATAVRDAHDYGMISLVCGSGRLIIDQVRWDVEWGLDARTTRYASTLLTNLGVPLLSLDYVEPSSRCVPLDISSACNTTLVDDVPEDGLGWTGRGPDNDLRRLSPGTLMAACMPFEILPAEKAGIMNCCVIGPDDELIAQPIKVGHAARAFAFLLACEGHVEHGTPIAYLTVQYSDGLEARIPLRYGIDVHDWNERARNLEGAAVAWKGTTALGEPAVVYVKKWQATRPGVPVKAVVFSSTNSGAVPALLAVTALA